MTNSDFSPATLEDVPRVSGARYSRAHLSESVPRIGLFGAPPLSEGYVILLGGKGSGPSSTSPSEFLLSVLRRSRAAKIVCVCLCVLFVCFTSTAISLEIMGQSITTPLSLTLQHWRDVQDTANNQSVEVHKKKWVIFCSSEWPTFNVGWPRDGTFNLDVILQVKAKVMNPGPHGHPDQVAYIVTWEALAYDPPPWVKPFVLPKPFLKEPSAPTLPPPLLPIPAKPLTQSSLSPIHTKPLQP